MSANIVIDSLCRHSDIILFSAAIPKQGGEGHINEQWPSYWAKLFKSWDFYPVDFLRCEIWRNASIPFWYRQNIMFFMLREKLEKINPELKKFLVDEIHFDSLDRVHPELFLQHYPALSY